MCLSVCVCVCEGEQGKRLKRGNPIEARPRTSAGLCCLKPAMLSWSGLDEKARSMLWCLVLSCEEKQRGQRFVWICVSVCLSLCVDVQGDDWKRKVRRQGCQLFEACIGHSILDNNNNLTNNNNNNNLNNNLLGLALRLCPRAESE